MTAGRHLRRPVTVGNRHGADAIIAGLNLHLALAETTIEVVTGVIVASHHPPPPGGIVGAQRLVLEDATSFAFAFSATPGERTGPGAFPWLRPQKR
jgi:hypothetical protein